MLEHLLRSLAWLVIHVVLDVDRVVVGGELLVWVGLNLVACLIAGIDRREHVILGYNAGDGEFIDVVLEGVRVGIVLFWTFGQTKDLPNCCSSCSGFVGRGSNSITSLKLAPGATEQGFAVIHFS